MCGQSRKASDPWCHRTFMRLEAPHAASVEKSMRGPSGVSGVCAATVDRMEWMTAVSIVWE